MSCDPVQPFDYAGDPALREPIERALREVVDPELGLSIVDVGLVYRVTVDERAVHIVLTMTSPACPVTDVVLADVEAELDRVVPPGRQIRLELVWDPPWAPQRMSAAARRFMGW